jgi:drug/metabolite transporter (DMT)-like permease
LTAVILGALFLDEHLHLRAIIGISIILVAVCIIVLHQKNRKHI